jgi:Zn-dependent metalloprotease
MIKKITQSIGALLLIFNVATVVAINQKREDILSERKSDVSSIPCYVEFKKGKEPLAKNIKSWFVNNYQLSSDFEFQLLNQEKDQLGFVHYRYQQMYKGIPIQGSRLILHTKNGLVHSFNGVLFESMGATSASPKIQEKEALAVALKHVKAEKYKWETNGAPFPKGKLVYTFKNGKLKKNNLCLAYQFDIYATKPLYRAYVYVDAVQNKVVNEENRIHNADVQGTANTAYSGTQTITTDSYNGGFRLRETGRGNGIETYNLQQGYDYTTALDFTDTDNNWTTVNAQLDQYATDTHWGTEKVYDYYSINFNRNSIDNNGFKLTSYVHYDVNYFNAFWDGSVMTYGDGDPSTNSTPLVSVDIVGHEITHGLTEFSAGLIYAGESGGLNESFSDIFGQCIEFYAKPNAASWLLGDEIGYTIRSIDNPNLFSCPDTYHGQFWDPSEEVHNISGVQNFWFYLLSTGGAGTNDNGDSYNVTGIGIDDAAKIAYRNLTVYLTPNSTYADARFYSLQSAIDLFGPCSPQVAATGNAWYAVGVGGLYLNTVQSDFDAGILSYCSAPATVTFANNSSNGIGYLWDFGDGSTSTLVSPTHTYTNFGTYTVTLITSGGSCGIDTLVKTNYINIDSLNPCIVSIPATGNITQTECSGVLSDDGGLSANYSTSSNGSVVIAPIGATSITLTFTDFAMEDYYDYLTVYAGPDNTYPLIGSYTGTSLPGGGTITVNSGVVCIQQTSDSYVEMLGFVLNWQCGTGPVEPIANFTADSVISCSGIIQFTDLSTNSPTSWFWDFGDGNTSTLQNPSHTYTLDGYYTVTLQATNGTGSNSYYKYNFINVNAGFCNGVNMPAGSTSLPIQTACIGVLYDDGGVSANYSDNTNSAVVIAPTGATLITLIFSVFDFENNSDFIEIYDGSVVAPNMIIGHYTGNTLPNGGYVYAYADTITILQHSDASNAGQGFAMVWECSSQAIFPNVAFSADSVASCSGLIHFQDQTFGAPTSWSWDFGDGNTSTLQNPTHQYTTSGIYSVILYATNSAGTGSYYATNYIHVSEAICSSVSMPVTQSLQITSCSGILVDNGGIIGNYADNTNSTVTINPAGATQITLNFSSFNMESGYDSLFIYAGASTSSPLIGGYSGNTLPNNGLVVVSAGSVTLRHYSDISVNYSGFQMGWTCNSTIGIEDKEQAKNNLLLYPNPASNEVVVAYTSSSNNNFLSLSLTSAIGQKMMDVVLEKTAQSLQSQTTIDLSKLSNGVYFIEVKDGFKSTTKKLVINR